MRSLRIRTYKTLDEYAQDLRSVRLDVQVLLTTVNRVMRLWNRQRIATLAAEVVQVRGGGVKGNLGAKGKSKTASDSSIKKKCKVLEQLVKKQEIFNAMLDQLDHSLIGPGIDEKVRLRMRRDTVAQKAAVEKAITEMKQVLGDIARGRLPERFRIFCNSVEQKITSLLKQQTKKAPEGRISKVEHEIVVSIDEHDHTRLDYYIIYHDLITDAGHIYSKYYVVLTMKTQGTTDKAGGDPYTIHVNTFTRYRTPGFKLSEAVPSDAKALRLILGQLKVDSVMDAVMSVQPPIDTKGLEKVHVHLKGVEIAQKTMYFTLKAEVKDKGQAETIRALVQTELNKVLKANAPRSKIVIRPKPIEGVAGRYKIPFKFVERGTEGGIGVYDFMRMQEVFGLSDKDLEKVKEALGAA